MENGGYAGGNFLDEMGVSVGAVVFETFLYGIYSVLFVIFVCIILQQQRRIHWIFQVSGLAQYLAASADIGYMMWLLFAKLLKGDFAFPYTYVKPKYFLYVTSSIFADSLLLYRCYIIWNRDKRILIGPGTLFIATIVCGYVVGAAYSPTGYPQSWVYILMTSVLNVILTTLTAGRIWWVARKARKGAEFQRPYNVVLMMLIESGFVYCLYVILNFAIHSNKCGNVVLDSSLIQIVGIMPTLILVQVGLGRTAGHDAKDQFTTVHARKYENAVSQLPIPQPMSSNLFSKRSHPTILEVSVTQSNISQIDQHSDWSVMQPKELSTVEHQSRHPNNDDEP